MNKEFSKGFSVGIIAPILLLLFYVIFILGEDIDSALSSFNQTNTITHHISLSVFIINLLFFFLFIKKQKDKIAQGIIGATFMYTFIVIYIKFF